MRRLEQHAGDELVAAWLVGSTALGDFDMTRSDVDVQAVADAQLPRPTLERIASRTRRAAVPGPRPGVRALRARRRPGVPAEPQHRARDGAPRGVRPVRRGRLLVHARRRDRPPAGTAADRAAPARGPPSAPARGDRRRPPRVARLVRGARRRAGGPDRVPRVGMGGRAAAGCRRATRPPGRSSGSTNPRRSSRRSRNGPTPRRPARHRTRRPHWWPVSAGYSPAERARRAPATRLSSFLREAQRAVWLSPQSGETLRRSAGAWRRHARIRSSTSSADST